MITPTHTHTQRKRESGAGGLGGREGRENALEIATIVEARVVGRY